MVQLEQITSGFREIPIKSSAFEKMRRYAALVPNWEMYGALLVPKNDDSGVTSSVILARGQKASQADVVISPEAGLELQSEIEEMGMKMIGIWHSHGNFGVFHSGIDDNNMGTFFRSYSLNNQEKVYSPPKEGFRKDEESGDILAFSGGLQWKIKLKDKSKLKVGRIPPSNFKIGSQGMLAQAAHLKNGCFYIRFNDQRSIRFPVEDMQMQVTPAAPELGEIVGATYSVVVNGAGNSYGEIWGSRYNMTNDRESSFVKKDAKLNIIRDRIKIPSDASLINDVKERVEGIRKYRRQLV